MTLVQDIPLAAPVTISLRASVVSVAKLPSCSYYNEETGRWDSSGLVLDSVTELSVGEAGEMDIQITCVSFHLSDFTATTTEVEPVFQPVTLVSPLFDQFQVNASIIVYERSEHNAIACNIVGKLSFGQNQTGMLWCIS